MSGQCIDIFLSLLSSHWPQVTCLSETLALEATYLALDHMALVHMALVHMALEATYIALEATWL